MNQSDAKPVDIAAQLTQHHRSLWVVAVSVVANVSDADDVMQEAAIIAMRKQHDFTPGTSFRAWMGEIVRNVALNRRRQTKREIRRFGYLHEVKDVSSSPQSSTSSPMRRDGSLKPMQEAIDDQLLAALMQLDPVARACFLLRSLEGMDYAEISQLLDLPKGTAMSHVFRCRRILASALTTPQEPTA